MAEIFISYSRHDIEFVRKLYQALEEKQRQAWIDWKDIPPSVEWLKEIYAAIEAAPIFISIISPDAVMSAPCRQEIDHAIANNKRVIPLVCRDINPQDAPEVIAARNWIYSREHDDFAVAFGLLLQAMDTDWDWIKAHTRLQVRATEWEAHQSEMSFDLRGKDLHEAEQWLARANAKAEPHPTTLQTQYILASRRNNSRRERIVILATMIAVLSVVILAFLSRQHARQAAFAQAQELETGALSEMSGQSAQKAQVMLARALALDDRREVRERFLEARAQSARLLWRNFAPTGSRLLAISPNAEHFVVQDDKGHVRVWDVRRRQEAFTLSTITLASTSTLSCAVFTPDERKLIIGSEDGVIRLYDSLNGHLLRALHGHHGAIQYLALSADGTVLASTAPDLLIRLWNVATGQPIYAPLKCPQTLMSLALSPDGRMLVAGDWIDTAYCWDLKAGTPMRELNGHEDAVVGLAFSRDGSLLATGSWDGDVWLWDVKSGLRLRQLHSVARRILSVGFSHNANLVFTSSDDGVVQIWEATTGRIMHMFRSQGGPAKESVTCVAMDKSDQRIIMGSNDGVIDVWDLTRIGNPPELQTLRGHHRNVTCVTFSPDGRTLASGSVDGTIKWWNVLNDRQQCSWHGHNYGITGMHFSPDGQRFVTSSRDSTIRVWQVFEDKAHGSMEPVRKAGRPTPLYILRHPDKVWDFNYSPDGHLLASACGDGKLYIWNAITGQFIGALVTGRAPRSDSFPAKHMGEEARNEALCTNFSADGNQVAVGMQDNSILIWDVPRQHLRQTLLGHTQSIWDVAFSRDGRTLASASQDGTIRLWSLATGKQIRLLHGHNGPVFVVSWSPDGHTLASGGQDGTVCLWDIPQIGQEDRPSLILRACEGPIWFVTFSHDGTRLAAGSQDKTARIWNLAYVRELMQASPIELLNQAQAETGLTANNNE